MPTETWVEDLRAGRNDVAFDHLRRDRPSPSKFYSLGAVYMWAGEIQQTLDHFRGYIQDPPLYGPPSDLAFGMAGAAAWCLGDERLAVKFWGNGIAAGATVGGAYTRTVLLLYAVSVLTPSVFSRPSAEKLLMKRVSQQRVRNWPGPIAQFILGTAGCEDVRGKAVYLNRQSDKLNPKSRQWQLDFYELLKGAASGGMLRTSAWGSWGSLLGGAVWTAAHTVADRRRTQRR